MGVISKGLVATQEARGGGKSPAVRSRVCCWLWKVIRVACIIGACLACGIGGWAQSRLQGVRCDTKATLQVMGERTPDCGFLLGCPYEHHYCSSFWDLCRGQRSRTVILNASYLTLGGGLSGGGDDSWSGGAALNANFTFSFTSPYPNLRIEGYTYTPKRALGFLYFVERVHAASFAAASARCGPDINQEDGCCGSSSASARVVSASIQTSLASASVSSGASASCSCNSECMDCTQGGGGESRCDPSDCRGRRGYRANRVHFGRSEWVSYEEAMTGSISVDGSSVECGGAGSGAFVSAYSGLVIQVWPDPLGVPAIGDNEYAWTETVPAELRIGAAAMVHTWGWANPDTAWLASEVSFRTEPEIPTDYTKPGILTVARGSLLVAQSEVDGNMEDGFLVYKSDRLPPRNSDFGKKRVLFASKQGEVDYAEAEVFYPTDGTNHPQGGPVSKKPVIRECSSELCRREVMPGVFANMCFDVIPSSELSPNWLYYYIQAYSVSELRWGGSQLGDHLYGITCPFSQDIILFDSASPKRGYLDFPLFVLQNRSDSQGRTRPLITYSGDRLEMVKGIHKFIAIVEHERTHLDLGRSGVDQFCCSDPTNDGDRDGLSDSWEEQHGLDPGTPITAPPFHDSEVLAFIRQYGRLLQNKEKWKDDWALDGLQIGIPEQPFPWKYSTANPRANYLTDIP